MSGSVKIKRKGLNKLKKRINKIKAANIKVGYFGGEQHSTAGMSYAALASILEFGTVNANGSVIPPRPALRQLGFRWPYVYRNSFIKSIERDFSQTIKGHGSVEGLMDSSGKLLKSQYQQVMESWSTEGSQNRNNAELTIQLKGFDKPFDETGELIRNVKYKVD